MANYNKTKIEIGHQHDRWMGLKEARWECKHRCHCACSSEIGTCLINDAERQPARQKKQGIYTLFCGISPNVVLYSCFESIYIKTNFQINHQNQRHYTFKNKNQIKT